MKTIKTLIVTRRTTPPISIRQCLAATNFLSPKFVDPAYSKATMTNLLSKERPGLIMLDGEYGPADRQLWINMSRMNQSELRLMLANPQSILPASLKMMELVHALKDDSTFLVIFIDGASDFLRTELQRHGASFVWPTLNRLSKYESSFYQIVVGVKTLASGVTSMAKSLFDSLTKK